MAIGTIQDLKKVKNTPYTVVKKKALKLRKR